MVSDSVSLLIFHRGSKNFAGDVTNSGWGNVIFLIFTEDPYYLARCLLAHPRVHFSRIFFAGKFTGACLTGVLRQGCSYHGLIDRLSIPSTTLIFYCRHSVHWLDYGLPLRLNLSNQVHEPCIRSSKWISSKRMCNL